MLFSKIAVAAAAFVAGVAAAGEKPFEITALRSASDIHFARVGAAKGSLWLLLDGQNATCDTTADGVAEFNVVDNELYLYSTSNPPQKLYVDRSGMGQGKVGYVTGAESVPTNAQTTGWAFDSTGDLTFGGAGFIACPKSAYNAWSVWLDTGVTNPAGHTDCLGFSARTGEVASPVSCTYTA